MDKQDILQMLEDKDHLAHYGIKGQKWNIRRFQNEDGSLTPEGILRYKNSTFISGTTKTSEDGEFKRDSLPEEVVKEINNRMKRGEKFLIGDAPGIDSQVQDYLAKNKYKNVELFVSGDEVRKNAGKKLNWLVNNIDGENYEKYSKEWRAVKDIAMSNVAGSGIAVVIPNGSSATRKNIDRMYDRNRDVKVYQLGDEKFIITGKNLDDSLKEAENSLSFFNDLKRNNPKFSKAINLEIKELENELEQLKQFKHSDSSDFLAHYGIKGQEWGKRRFQNEDGSLTPEGRKRYGLKPDYSNLTDQQLREAISTKRTQNQYVDMMTADARKKRQELSELLNATSSVAGQAVNIADKTKFESDRQFFKDQNKDYGILVKDLRDQKTQALKDNPKANVSAIDADIEKYENEIAKNKDTINTINQFKEVSSASASGLGQHSGKIAKLATKGELEEKTQEAYRNIQEMNKDQLKKAVDRMMLEKEYNDLVNPPKPSLYARGKEILQTVGSTLGIVLTLLTIKNLLLDKKKDSDLDDGSEYLSHYGVKGMRKGERRYQNPDGSLTPEGYRHYGIDPNSRQASDPRAIVERQRAQIEAKRMQQRASVKQNAYTQKLARRQALRDARAQTQIQNVYARQALREQRAINKEEQRVKEENRANIRKNIVRGVASVAAIAGVAALGYHILRNASLDRAHVRDMERIGLEGRQRFKELRESGRLGILQETNRAKEAKAKSELELLREQNRAREAEEKFEASPEGKAFRAEQEAREAAARKAQEEAEKARQAREEAIKAERERAEREARNRQVSENAAREVQRRKLAEQKARDKEDKKSKLWVPDDVKEQQEYEKNLPTKEDIEWANKASDREHSKQMKKDVASMKADTEELLKKNPHLKNRDQWLYGKTRTQSTLEKLKTWKLNRIFKKLGGKVSMVHEDNEEVSGHVSS